MGILQILLFFSMCSTAYSCVTSYCGSFTLEYPFKKDTSNRSSDCDYINLSCISTDQLGTPVLNLPYSGDFNVRYIGYYEPNIQLYDPGDCLMGRLMKLNLSSSPFKAIQYQKYTFYTCPLSASLEDINVLPIDCLGNNTSKTIATATISPNKILNKGCGIIGRFQLPVLEQDQFEYVGVYSDLYLTWNSFTCTDCPDGYRKESNDTGDSNNLWIKFVRSAYFIPTFVILVTFLVVFSLQMTKLIAERCGARLDFPTADAQPGTATAPPGSGLDDSKINSCTELVVISESRINIGPDNSTCSICLESYVAQDKVRSIAKCEHWFHAECIELWLRKNKTCPVCRTDLADVVERV